MEETVLHQHVITSASILVTNAELTILNLECLISSHCCRLLVDCYLR